MRVSGSGSFRAAAERSGRIKQEMTWTCHSPCTSDALWSQVCSLESLSWLECGPAWPLWQQWSAACSGPMPRRPVRDGGAVPGPSFPDWRRGRLHSFYTVDCDPFLARWWRMIRSAAVRQRTLAADDPPDVPRLAAMAKVISVLKLGILTVG